MNKKEMRVKFEELFETRFYENSNIQNSSPALFHRSIHKVSPMSLASRPDPGDSQRIQISQKVGQILFGKRGERGHDAIRFSELE